MHQTISRLRHLTRDQRGVTRIEYGIISCVVTVACAASFETVAKPLIVTFATIGTALAGLKV